MTLQAASRKALVAAAVVSCASEEPAGRSEAVAEWALEPVVRVGSVDGEHDAFGRIVSILADDAGTLYVADAQASEIRVFDSTGAYVRTIGRTGRGPGELGDLYALAWLGDTLAASDPRNARIGLFHKDGAWIGHFRHQPVTGPPLFLRLHRAGPATFHARIVRRADAGLEGLYVRYTRDGPADTVPAPERDPRASATSVTCFGTDGGIRGFEAPFAGRSLYTFGPDAALLTAWSADYRIAFSVGADTTRGVSRTVPAVPVTDAEWDSATAEYRAYRERDPGGRCDGAMERPRVKAVVRHFWLDHDGRLWVERVTFEGFAFDVFDADGRLLATTPAPVRDARVEPYARAGRLYVVSADAQGVQGVEGFRIVDRAGNRW